MLGDVSGARVLDLYAGSGALGIEALSRGAESARVRGARPAARSRRSRATSTRSAPTRRSGARTSLRFLARPEGIFDLVFCDPPYDAAPRVAAPLSEALPAMLERTLDRDRIRQAQSAALPLPLVVERTYGDTRIAIHST